MRVWNGVLWSHQGVESEREERSLQIVWNRTGIEIGEFAIEDRKE